METILTFYPRHYPRKFKWLSSHNTRKVVENEVMPENEKINLNTEPSLTDTLTSSAESVLLNSENDVSVSSFCGYSECTADKSHIAEDAKHEFESLCLYFHSSPSQRFPKKLWNEFCEKFGAVVTKPFRASSQSFISPLYRSLLEEIVLDKDEVECFVELFKMALRWGVNVITLAVLYDFWVDIRICKKCFVVMLWCCDVVMPYLYDFMYGPVTVPRKYICIFSQNFV